MAEKQNSGGWIPVVYAVLFVVSCVLFGVGVSEFTHDRGTSLLAAGAVAMIVTLAAWPVASLIAARGGAAARVMQSQERALDLLTSINDRLLISDTAKRIAYREKDRDALRSAIREDIHKGDYEAALVLVHEMSQTYGYREEGEEFRDQILVARAADMDHKVSQAVDRLEQMLGRHEWDKASSEAAKIQRLYPDSPRVVNLQRHVRDSRESRKHQLEREFLQAAERDDVEKAMDLLKEMDKYLTESEAEPFRETARGVIGKKRQNLGVQFKLAVQDKEWTSAVRVGEQLIKEFPNSKMADEVRAMLDLLRARAAGEQAARTQEEVV